MSAQSSEPKCADPVAKILSWRPNWILMPRESRMDSAENELTTRDSEPMIQEEK
jgi:hypothetical protein